MVAQVNGTELFYQACGRGMPLLLMHGGLGWDHSYFRPWLDALSADVQLIYYDHRGNGCSQRDLHWDEITHLTWIEDAEALREHLGHDRILLLGHSYGGFLAQEYVLRYPDRVAGLILCSTSPALDYPATIMANAQARGSGVALEGVTKAFSGPVPDDRSLEEIMRMMMPLYFHRDNASADPPSFGVHAYSSAAYNHAFGSCVPKFNTMARLHEIRVPTLLISGTDDWIMPLSEALMRLQSGISQADVATLEHSGHFPFIEEPERFITIVRQWLSREHFLSSRPPG